MEPNNNLTLINLSCELEFDNYKKKLIKNIFIQLDNIIDTFKSDINDNIIKLYILYKKNKLEDIIKYLTLLIYSFSFDLHNLKYFDQMEFVEIILKLIRIYWLIIFIDDNYKSYESLKFIDWSIIKNSFSKLISDLEKANKFVKLIIGLGNFTFDEKKSNSKIKNSVHSIAHIMCYDFFMYFSSSQAHKLLVKKLSISSKYDSVDKNKINKLGLIFVKYKKYFIDEYRNKYSFYTDLYSDIKDSNYTKFKLDIKNCDFIELIRDFNSVNSNI